MKSREDIKREYRERQKPAGIFCIKNISSGRLLLGSSLNLEGVLNRHKFMLSINQHPNKKLQHDWNEQGPDKFIYETLEVIEVKEEAGFNINDELTLLEQIWIEKLNPFGKKGYNLNKNIRQV